MKIKSLIIVLLVLLILAVNAVTVCTFLKKRSQTVQDTETIAGNSTETSEESEDEVSYFGNPSEIIVFGDGIEKTVLPSDSDFSIILDYCEKIMSDAVSLEGVDSFDYREIRAYGVRLVYNDKFSITPKGYSTFEVNEVVIVLTGEHNSTISFEVNGYPFALGRLAVHPDFNELVVEKVMK